MSYSMLELEHIQEAVIEEGILDKEDVSKFEDKEQLIDWLVKYNIDYEQLCSKYFDVEEIEFEEEQYTPEVNEEEKKEFVVKIKEPKYTSPQWHDFILSQFEPSELDNLGNPLLTGLRRLTEKYIGEILFSGAIDIKTVPPDDNDCGWCLCNYKVDIAWKKDVEFISVSVDGLRYTTKSFLGIAEAHKNNLQRPYDKFVAAMAESRAESRALRKALQLKVVSSEELDITEKAEMDQTAITGPQRSHIKLVCSQHGIDPEKLSQLKCSKSFGDLLREEGLLVMSELKKYVKNPESIEEEIKVDESND